jgi:pyrimidine deaminase RibD-like protein
MSIPIDPKTIKRGDHIAYLRYALSFARLSPPKPTNFRVGAVLVDADVNAILATGYTLELAGNTHAEQCCFSKLAVEHSLTEAELGKVLPPSSVLYTTMEPCNFRLSGNEPCVQRILRMRENGSSGIGTVVCGVKEPEKFIGQNQGRQVLENAGIEILYITDLQEEILEVATAGHKEKDVTS